tara:strand:+ start:738 stop:893 length:156 start_codon:yes stop_codon:yes gene_type:complete
MAKSIEETPVLEGKDAERFLEIISKVDQTTLETHEEEVKEMVNKIPKKLKF